MILKNFTETPEGLYEFEYEASDEEKDALIRYALTDLIEKGLIDTSEESAISDPDSFFDFDNDYDKEKLH